MAFSVWSPLILRGLSLPEAPGTTCLDCPAGVPLRQPALWFLCLLFLGDFAGFLDVIPSFAGTNRLRAGTNGPSVTAPAFLWSPERAWPWGMQPRAFFLRQTCFPSALSSPPEDWLWSHLTLISGGSGCPRTSQAQFQFVSLMSWRFSFLYDPTCVSKAPFCYTTKLGSLLEIDMPSTSCHLTVSLFSHVPQAVPAE